MFAACTYEEIVQRERSVENKEIVRSLLKMGIKGIDRVVRIGHSMEFDLIWDGYDLVERLSRKIHF